MAERRVRAMHAAAASVIPAAAPVVTHPASAPGQLGDRLPCPGLQVVRTPRARRGLVHRRPHRLGERATAERGDEAGGADTRGTGIRLIGRSPSPLRGGSASSARSGMRRCDPARRARGRDRSRDTARARRAGSADGSGSPSRSVSGRDLVVHDRVRAARLTPRPTGSRRAERGCTGGADSRRAGRGAPTRRSARAYITPRRSDMYRTTARSWLTKRYVSPSRSCSSRRRLRICAWIETSTADTASSRTTSSGSSASARAIDTRWHCPPESSRG